MTPRSDLITLWRCPICPVIIPGDNRELDTYAHMEEHEGDTE